MRGSRVRSRAGLLVLMSLMASMAAFVVSVSPAAADSVETPEQRFCWEKTITKIGAEGVCYEEHGGFTLSGVTAKAWGESTSICIQAIGSPSSKRCSGGPGEWVSLPMSSEPGFLYPEILSNNPNKGTKVKGIIINKPVGGGAHESPPPGWHYQEIGGEFLGKPGITRPTATNVNIFVRGLDGNLWQTFTGGSGWSAWQNVSALTGGPIASGPSAVTESNGTVAVAAKLPNNSVGVWDYPPSGPWAFQTIGGGEILGEPSIALGHVFVRGLDGNLWQKYWTGSAWTAWQNLSAILGGPIASSPSAVSAAPNQLTIVARLANNHVGVWSWTGSQWVWQQLEGEIAGDPAIASGQTGGVNVFAQGLDGNLWQTWTSGVGWNAWQQLSTTPIRSSPGATGWSGANAGVDVVARSSNNQVGLWWYGN